MTIQVDDFKVSRHVQAQLGFTLAQAVENPVAMMRFQDAVFSAKYKHDLALSENATDTDVVIVERSFIDVLAYTRLWIDRLSLHHDECVQDWYRVYEKMAFNAQFLCYSGMAIVPSHPDIPFEHDENRASADTRHQYEQLFTKKFTECMFYVQQPFPFVRLESASRLERVQKTLSFMDSLPRRES